MTPHFRFITLPSKPLCSLYLVDRIITDQKWRSKHVAVAKETLKTSIIKTGKKTYKKHTTTNIYHCLWFIIKSDVPYGGRLATMVDLMDSNALILYSFP